MKPPGRRSAETVCARRGWPPPAIAENVAVAVNSSSAAVTSRCAMAWVPPDSGILMGTATLRTAARTSTATQQTSCSQASQTMTDRIWMRLRRLSGWVCSLAVGPLCGMGSPSTVTSATGTPTISTASAAIASTPAAISPAVRRRWLSGRLSPGVGGAIGH
ncbi:MAG TPA: hypothetical protein VGM53_10535 [Streptosporangiaceae bacterium]|jgi:hypothetical protein